MLSLLCFCFPRGATKCSKAHQTRYPNNNNKSKSYIALLLTAPGRSKNILKDLIFSNTPFHALVIEIRKWILCCFHLKAEGAIFSCKKGTHPIFGVSYEMSHSYAMLSFQSKLCTVRRVFFQTNICGHCYCFLAEMRRIPCFGRPESSSSIFWSVIWFR